MGADPEVSVIIPTFRRACLLKGCLQSVVNQSFTDWELLVVDDGSEDGTDNLVNTWDDSRIRYICHSQNLGAAAARNTGILNARGRYIAFLDSDDRWLPEKLRLHVDFMNGRPELQVSSTAWFRVDEDGWGVEVCPRARDWREYLLMGCDFAPGTTLLARRECFDRVGLQDDLFPRQEDWDWMVRMIHMFPHGFQVLSEPLAVVIPGPWARAEKVEQANLRMLEKHCRMYEQRGVRARRARAELLRQIGFYYYLEGNVGKMVHYYLKTLVAFPLPRLRDVLLALDAVLGTRTRLRLDLRSGGTGRKVRVRLDPLVIS